MGVLECSASLKPSDTTHVTSKGATFFPEMVHELSHLKVCLLLGVLWFCLNSMAQEPNQSRGSLVSEGEINHIPPETPICFE